MEENAIESNYNTIKEMVLDEEKLVTYVSLSKDLCMHVNDSKRLLAKFVANLREKQPDVVLDVSYIVSGLVEGNKARTTVSNSKDIDNLKNDFKLVFFEHIYSVMKGSEATDKVVLLSVNRLEDFPLCTGLIKNNLCTKRSSDEIGSLISSSKVSVPDEQKTVAQKKVKAEGTKNEEAKVVKVHETKSEPAVKTEKVSPKKDTSNKSKSAKPQKGIAGFFSKSNSAPGKIIGKVTQPKLEIKEEKQSTKEKELIKTNEVEKISTKAKNEAMDVDTPDERKELSKTGSKVKKNGNVNGNSKNEKLKQIKKNAKVDNKRKRLLLVSDSESDEEKDPFGNEDEDVNISEDEIPPTPTTNTVKITSGITNPKKRRKIVDKTYTDDEGYILTKKVEVYESCSDNDETEVKENITVSPPKQVKKNPSPVKKDTSPPEKKANGKGKKKISPPQKGKQATMMNFFKKV